jgi:heterodisulfide reductase subunit A-like polyferredoxin
LTLVCTPPTLQQVASATAQALELWRTHVAEAAWARPIAQRVSAVNDELKVIEGGVRVAVANRTISNPHTWVVYDSCCIRKTSLP